MSLLEKNLGVLREVSPSLTALVASLAVPSGFALTAGTDGTPTYRRILASSDGHKCVEWLGATSMPRASADPIVASLDAHSKGNNGLGLSIGTGFEWSAFIRRLGRAQMVFIYEPDPAFLRMALEICDLAELLRNRRLVLLSGAADLAARDLAAFLTHNPGFEPPSVLHPLCTITGERRAQLLAAGESIVRHAVLDRQRMLNALQAEIVQALGHSRQGSAAESCLAFVLTPRYAHERPIQDESERLGARRIFIDRHDSSSSALRLKALAEHLGQSGEPGLSRVRVLSDLFRNQLATVPPEIPVETWVSPLVGPGFWERVGPSNSLSPDDRIVVHAEHHADLLRNAGIKQEQIEFRPVVPMRQALPALEPSLSLRHRIAIIGDLSATDAASLGINLPTHKAVLAAACELITADYLTVHPGAAADLRRRALTRAGVDPHSQDSTLQEPMLRVIRDILIPTLPLLALARALAQQELPVTLIGDWGILAGMDRYVAAGQIKAIPFSDIRGECWQKEGIAVLAHLSPTGTVSPIIWEAIAADVAIAAPTHPSDRKQGSLATMLKPELHYARAAPQQFVLLLKSLLRDSARRRKLASAAREAMDKFGRAD